MSIPSSPVEAVAEAEDVFLDQALRPSHFSEYVGQESVKENLRILLTAAKERNHRPEHLLFYGPPGLGKTTLAYLIAKEMNTQIKVTSGPVIERAGDLVAIMSNLSDGDILFIDEIHRLHKTIEEILYPAMESGGIDMLLGKGPSARTIRVDLPRFTLVAATTRIALLSGPLRSRFGGGTFRLDYYTNEEIEKILLRSAKILGTDIEREALREIARRSRATPRTANFLLKRVRDYAQVHRKVLDRETVMEALKLLGVDALGLSAADRAILSVIIEKFRGGPTGLNTLAAATSEEEATIEEVYEPYLIQLGLLERTPRGRVATKRAYEHLGEKTPKEAQEKLL